MPLFRACPNCGSQIHVRKLACPCGHSVFRGSKPLTTRNASRKSDVGAARALETGHYKHWTRDPRTGDPRTRGPGTQGPKDPRTRGAGTQGPRFLRAVLDCSSSNTTMQAISANATCLTHNYVLYVVAMHTEGVIYSRQRYSLTSLILRVVYCQFCKARLAHRHDTQSKRVWRPFAF